MFFTSYKMMNTFKHTYHKPLMALDGVHVHFDSEDAFEKHQASVKAKKISVLLSVMGGSLSEGINFKDNLGRSHFY